MISVPPRESPVWKTPLYEQYWSIKDGVPGAFLFFRLGDFYELFGQDAVEAAPLLEVQLTSRNKDAETPVPMCGVPVHAIENYAERLLAHGKKIALCEQLSEPGVGTKKIVERGVVRILTPGLPVDDSRLEAKSSHWMMIVGLGAGEKADVLLYDFLAGQLLEGEVSDLSQIEDLLSRHDPKEVLVPMDLLSGKNSRRKKATWLDESGRWYSRLTPWAGQRAREILEGYLLYTQRCSAEKLASFLPEAKALLPSQSSGSKTWAELPVQVSEQWNLVPDLFELLDGCGSAVGSRRLRTLIENPLADSVRIQTRQKVLSGLDGSSEILALSREVYDFERLLGRFRVGAAAPKELLRFLHSLVHVERVLTHDKLNRNAWAALVSSEGLKPWTHLLEHLRALKESLVSALETTVDVQRLSSLTELIRVGFDADFDRLRSLKEDSQKWLADYEERLKQETSIPSLKVRYNRVFGYYIEVTKTHLAKTPAHFERKQTTVSGERFTTAELRERESEILSADLKAESKAKDILEQLARGILAQDGELKHLIEGFSWVDALLGLSERVRKLERFGPWIFPEVQTGDFHFSIQDLRHPIIEAQSVNFVPNSIELGSGSQRIMVLTGPNMAGKSTLMRSTGLALVMAQSGFPVPASRMTLSPAHGFFSRMGAQDKILQGESTFMVEMKETSRLLRDANRQSFVLVDEIGRGTSTQDGLAIARAVLEDLHDRVGALVIFATHYHELSDVAAKLPQAVNASMSIQEWNGDLVFLRQLELKPAASSYGIFVAKMAGLPRDLVRKAERYYEAFRVDGPRPDSQLSMFDSAPVVASISLPSVPTPSKVEEELSAVDLDDLTPRQAWLLIEQLKSKLKN